MIMDYFKQGTKPLPSATPRPMLRQLQQKRPVDRQRKRATLNHYQNGPMPLVYMVPSNSPNIAVAIILMNVLGTMSERSFYSSHCTLTTLEGRLEGSTFDI